MLINPVFDKYKILNGFIPESRNLIRYRTNKIENVVEIKNEESNKWEAVFGFQKIQDGVYWTDLNPHFMLSQIYGHKLQEYAWNQNTDLRKFFRLPQYKQQEFYGVGDSPEQILQNRWIKKRFIEPQDEKFVMCCTPIVRANQPERDGWRFGGWGKYIGKHKIQYEYLYHHEDIDEVVVYHFYKILD